MLECFEPDDWEDSAALKSAPRPAGVVSWRLGRRFLQPLPEPLEFEMLETHSDQLLEFYNEQALVMTKRLLATLQEAGVDNLDVYAARIKHPVTGAIRTDYVAANLIGVVSAADLGKSRVIGGSADGLVDVDFESVVVNERRAGDALMFRLAENTSAILVHEKVRQHLLEKGFAMLSFLEPEEWMG